MNRKIFLTLTIFAICYWFLFDFLRWIEFDTAGYIGGARLLFNLNDALNIQSRISKPLVLILPGLSELLFGIHPKYVFLFQNLTCFYLCGYLMYRIMGLITKDEKLSYLSMLAYMMCQPFAVYSLFVQVDVVGWFFELTGIYLSLKWIVYSEKIELKKIALTAFISGLGCLAKESAVIGFMFMLSCILFLNLRGSKKFRFLFISSFFFLFPVVISQIITDHFFDISIVKRVIEEQQAEGFVYYNKRNFQQLFRIIDMFWVPFIIGVFNLPAIIKKYNCKLVLKAMGLTAISALIIMPVYPFIVDRILFMVAPLLIPTVIFGTERFKPYALILILTGGILNIMTSFLIYKFNTGGLLWAGLVLYLLLILLLFNRNKQKNRAQGNNPHL
jgi:hypothetical protein